MRNKLSGNPAGPTSNDDALFTPKDFVFCGVRRNLKGDGFICIRAIEPGTCSLGEEANYSTKNIKRVPYIIGGVYRGLKFGHGEKAGMVRGLAREYLTYVSRWPEAEQVMEWEALHGLAIEAEESAALERKADKVSEIERAMLPLRRLYWAQFNSYGKQQAIERAVLKALRTPVKEKE